MVAGALLLGGRRREARAASLVVGDDSTAVVRALGQPPHRCEASNLSHLESQFPAGTPRPTIDEELVKNAIPSPATMFQRRSSAPNSAFSAAIRMSASRAVSSPAATS